MAQVFRYTLPFSSNDLRLIEEAVERVLGSSRHRCIDRAVVRHAVETELRHGAPVMYRLVKAGHRACDDAVDGIRGPAQRCFADSPAETRYP